MTGGGQALDLKASAVPGASRASRVFIQPVPRVHPSSQVLEGVRTTSAKTPGYWDQVLCASVVPRLTTASCKSHCVLQLLLASHGHSETSLRPGTDLAAPDIPSDGRHLVRLALAIMN